MQTCKRKTKGEKRDTSLKKGLIEGSGERLVKGGEHTHTSNADSGRASTRLMLTSSPAVSG